MKNILSLTTNEQKNLQNKEIEYLKSDNPNVMLDKKWFDIFELSYKFNNLGFRDEDVYLKDFNNGIFAIGDSMTLGLGLNYNNTWPKKLENLIEKRVIKLAWQAVSNDWIVKCFDTIKNYSPKIIFIQLTLLQRKTNFFTNHVEHLQIDEDLMNIKNYEIEFLNKCNIQLNYILSESQRLKIKTFITFVPDFNFILGKYKKEHDIMLSKNYDSFIFYKRFFDKKGNLKKYEVEKDLARDKFHFGEKTCDEIAVNFYKKYLESIK